MTLTGETLFEKRVSRREADGSQAVPPTTAWTSAPSLETPHMSHDWEAMEERMRQLEQEVYSLRQFVDEVYAASEETITLREIPREQAKQEIAALFSGDEVLYYGDIAERLDLDLETVVDICNELEDEGIIGEYAAGGTASRRQGPHTS